MRMVGSKANEKALSLVELMVAVVALAVLTLIGWAAWEMSHRESAAAQARTQAYQNTFAVMQRLKYDIMLATSIEIPDPDYAHLDSIQVRVASGGGTVRRAFRLVDEELIIDKKDEAAPSFAAFDGISKLEFTMVDPPTDSMVRIVCASEANGHEIEMETVVKKRN